MSFRGHLRLEPGQPWALADGADPAALQQLYAAHGPAMLHRLRGGFALALFDGETLLLETRAAEGRAHRWRRGLNARIASHFDLPLRQPAQQ